jgi:hypothetical protein
VSLSLFSGVLSGTARSRQGRAVVERAKRTLDGEDRSEMIAEEGKAGRKIGERWSAILGPSAAAFLLLTKRLKHQATFPSISSRSSRILRTARATPASVDPSAYS